MRNHILLTALLVGTSSLATAAYAQNTGKSQAVGLEEIVVTAQRVEETAQHAAIAISVVQPSEMAGVTTVGQLTNIVPSLQITDGGAAPLLYIRGVGTFAANPYTDSAVAVNYDGVYLGRPTSARGLFYDLERVEVLKGPQGTLYGRNATGGALNILPAKPRLGVYSFAGSVDIGNYQSHNVEAAANIPLGDNAAFRLAATSNSHDGYNKDGTSSEEGNGVRAQLLYKPTDKLSVRIAADYFKLGGTGITASPVAILNPMTGVTSSLNLPKDVGFFDPRSVALLNSPAAFSGAAGAPYGALPGRPFVDSNFSGVSGEVQADLGWANLTVVPAWRRSKLNETQLPTSFLLQQDETDEQFSVEARLNGKVGRLDWLGGLYYYDETVRAQYAPNNIIFGASQRLAADNTSYAAFGRLVFNVTDSFRLTAAGRYTQDEKTFRGVSETAQAICTSPTHLCPNIRRLPANILDLPGALASIGYIRPPFAPVYIDALGTSDVIWAAGEIPVNKSLTSDKFTYRVGAEYEPMSNSLLYASFETGYRSGGFSFSTIKPTYQPETIDAFTIGAKNRFFDNRLQFNVELFHWIYKNQQVAHTTIGAGGGLEFATENIGQSTNQGVEVELVARPVENTLLRADVQYLSAKNDNFIYNEVDVSPLAGLPPGTVQPASRCPSTLTAGTGTYRINCSGLRALRSPEWTVNLGIQQTIPLSNGYKIVAEGNSHYQSSTVTMFERREFGTQPGYWTVDAALGFHGAADRWGVTAYINNIGNQRIDVNPFYLSFNNVTSGIYTAPRTYGIRLDFKM